jgi:hypothetical protein
VSVAVRDRSVRAWYDSLGYLRVRGSGKCVRVRKVSIRVIKDLGVIRAIRVLNRVIMVIRVIRFSRILRVI